MPARLFHTLHKVRDIRIEWMLSSPCAMSGGRAHVYSDEPQSVALDAQNVIALAGAWGFDGFDLIDLVETIFEFEDIYLRLSRIRAAERMKQWNR